jgi:hypothetical protein
MRTFATAVAGVDRVAPISDPDPALTVGGFLDVAVAAGTRRVALLSASAVTDAPAGLGALPPLVRDRVPEVAGSEERVTTTVRDVTGRAPRSFRDFLIDAHRPLGHAISAQQKELS